jgi:cytochrome c-type biogenesis protein CcmH
VLVRDRLTAGDTDRQVLDFLVARYGEFVLLKPRFEWQTLPLWLAPVALLVVGGLTLLVAVRRRHSTRGAAPEAPAPLSEREQARLAEITEAGQS